MMMMIIIIIIIITTIFPLSSPISSFSSSSSSTSSSLWKKCLLLRLSKSLCNWITGRHKFWYCCLRQRGFSAAIVLFCSFRSITIALYDHAQQRFQGNISKWKITYGFYLRRLNRRTFLTIAIFVSDT